MIKVIFFSGPLRGSRGRGSQDPRPLRQLPRLDPGAEDAAPPARAKGQEDKLRPGEGKRAKHGKQLFEMLDF